MEVISSDLLKKLSKLQIVEYSPSAKSIFISEVDEMLRENMFRFFGPGGGDCYPIAIFETYEEVRKFLDDELYPYLDKVYPLRNN